MVVQTGYLRIITHLLTSIYSTKESEQTKLKEYKKIIKRWVKKKKKVINPHARSKIRLTYNIYNWQTWELSNCQFSSVTSRLDVKIFKIVHSTLSTREKICVHWTLYSRPDAFRLMPSSGGPLLQVLQSCVNSSRFSCWVHSAVENLVFFAKISLSRRSTFFLSICQCSFLICSIIVMLTSLSNLCDRILHLLIENPTHQSRSRVAIWLHVISKGVFELVNPVVAK